MRRACCLLLFFVACQNRTEERLQKVEKDISQIKSNPQVETVVAPASTAATDTASLPIEKRVNALQSNVAAVFVHQHQAAYVPLSGRSTGALVYQIEPGQTVLYRFDESGNLYRPVQVVDDLQRDGNFDLVPDYLARLQHILEPYPLEKTYGQIRDDVARELYIEKGKGEFIPTNTDAEAGLVAVVGKGQAGDTVVFKFDQSIGQYRPVEAIPSLAGANGRLVLEDARRAELKGILAKY